MLTAPNARPPSYAAPPRCASRRSTKAATDNDLLDDVLSSAMDGTSLAEAESTRLARTRRRSRYTSLPCPIYTLFNRHVPLPGDLLRGG